MKNIMTIQRRDITFNTTKCVFDKFFVLIFEFNKNVNPPLCKNVLRIILVHETTVKICPSLLHT